MVNRDGELYVPLVYYTKYGRNKICDAVVTSDGSGGLIFHVKPLEGPALMNTEDIAQVLSQRPTELVFQRRELYSWIP